MSWQAQSLFDSFLAPVVAPDQPYRPGERTVAWRRCTNGQIVVEVFQRSNDSFGFRYRAWVAWRDAGGEVHSHSWWEKHPEHALFTDELETARTIAEQHASAKGINLEPQWTSVV